MYRFLVKPDSSSLLHGSLSRTWWWNLLSACLIGLILLWSSWYTQEWNRYVHLLFPLILYFGLLSLFNRYGALACTTAFIYSLHAINQKKMQATTEPVLAIDLLQFRQAAALTSYIDFQVLLGPLLLLLALGWSVTYQRSRLRLWARCLFVSPFALAFLIQNGSASAVSEPIKNFLSDKLSIKYIIWDLPGNLQTNGLLGHLWFTASVTLPPTRTSNEIAFYRQASVTRPAPIAESSKPTDVYLILCEACWGEDNHLDETALALLIDTGFHATTIYSPEFGGITANAEFEMLTGLPARGMSGTVYMNYGRWMREKSGALPNELRDQGYETYAMHNFTRTFWNRDVVYPKFGFERLTFIDEMPWDGKRWPNDQLLFDAAWEQVQDKTLSNRFFFLLTVHTHGSYLEQDDSGQGDYAARLKQSVTQLSEFITKVKESNKKVGRRSLFIVFGDHKPSLLKWFYETGALDKALFQETGASNSQFSFVTKMNAEQLKALNSVPLLVASDDPEVDSAGIIKRLEQKPFYCVSAELAMLLLEKPSDFYRATSNLCGSEQLADKIFTEKLFTEDLFSRSVYADRLFE